jgi:hypothetical protein
MEYRGLRIEYPVSSIQHPASGRAKKKAAYGGAAFSFWRSDD